MDSRPETYAHIHEVQKLLSRVIKELLDRQQDHDQSKLVSPEVEYFDEYTGKLRNTTYGSEEYEKFRELMKPGLDHHYAKNSHHPEFHEHGMRGMTLIDLIEMLCDWKAASMRHANGCVFKSIAHNAGRFHYPPYLEDILINTARELFTSPSE